MLISVEFCIGFAVIIVDCRTTYGNILFLEESDNGEIVFVVLVAIGKSILYPFVAGTNNKKLWTLYSRDKILLLAKRGII